MAERECELLKNWNLSEFTARLMCYRSRLATALATEGKPTFNVSTAAFLQAMTAHKAAIEACRNATVAYLAKEGKYLVDEVAKTDRHASLHVLTSFFLEYFEKEDRFRVEGMSEEKLRQINENQVPEAIGLDVKSATLEELQSVFRLHLRNNRFKQYRWTC